MKTPVVLAAAIALITLGGCTRPAERLNWQNPDVPQAQWASDVRACKRYARREAEKEAGLAASAPVSDTLSGTASYNRTMSRHSLKNFEARIFNTCMTANGYAVKKK